MTPRICVSILPKTTTEALYLIEKAEDAHADFVEVRLDCFQDHSKLSDLAAHGKIPKIATCKPQSCHGKFSGTETEQRSLLFKAAKGGFKYVDIDLADAKLNETVKELKSLGTKTIVSFHDFAETPCIAELNRVLDLEIASGADVCKIVTTAKHVKDNLTLLNFTATVYKQAKIVCFAMGELGKISRLLSPLFGGYFIFAALERGNETAPGQMTIQEMRTVYALLGLQ
ncbi:MAG: type I 3-dehydroquinate dehydratase [Candidatus Bathyarchaeia archaeon]